jgi:hypothetical protein
MLEICTKMAKYAQNMQVNLFVTMANKVHFKVFRCKISPVIGQNIFIHQNESHPEYRHPKYRHPKYRLPKYRHTQNTDTQNTDTIFSNLPTGII